MPFVKTTDGPSTATTTFRLTPGSSQAEEFAIQFEGVVWGAIGRGTTDTDVVYLRLKNADGEACFIYPNATQDGIVVQATRP
ncbi:MAG: hypothetical protein R3F54_28730 [Alphaproteobacteria bacterium]